MTLSKLLDGDHVIRTFVTVDDVLYFGLTVTGMSIFIFWAGLRLYGYIRRGKWCQHCGRVFVDIPTPDIDLLLEEVAVHKHNARTNAWHRALAVVMYLGERYDLRAQMLSNARGEMEHVLQHVTDLISGDAHYR